MNREAEVIEKCCFIEVIYLFIFVSFQPNNMIIVLFQDFTLCLISYHGLILFLYWFSTMFLFKNE